MYRLLIFGLLGCATHPVPATPAPPTRAELEYFVGTWRAEATNPTNGKAFTLDYRVEPAVRGPWYFGSGRAAALDLDIHDVWGMDPVTGEIIRMMFDSAGTVGTVRSPGWRGDTLVLEGEVAANGGKVHVRETIEKNGRDELHAVWEMKQGETWVAYSLETLRRQR